MDTETNEKELERAQLRKKRRQKERMQALLILAGIAFVVLLVLGIGISAVVHAIVGKNNETEIAEVQTDDFEDVDNYIDISQDDAMGENEDEVESVVEDSSSEEIDETGAEVEETDGEADAAGDDIDSEDSELSESEDSETESEMSDEEISAEIEQQVTDKIQSMSIEEKVAQLFFITPGQLMGKESTVDTAGSQFNEKMNQYHVGGILFEESNMKDEDNLINMIANVQLMARNDLFIGVADEGGQDSPFMKAHINENDIASLKEIGSSLGEAGAYSAGISIGGQLKIYGFNVDFAPMGDTSLQKGSVAEQRGFGGDIEKNKGLTKNFIKGLDDQGICNAVKYFPSLGDATQDGKNGQITSNRTKADLEAEYPIYQEAIEAGADFVMISHVGLPKIRGDRRPASLSKEIITDIVRDEWGYDGIVITDYMNKSCIYNSYTYVEAAVGAIEAGADMLLSTKNFEKSYNGLLDAVKSGTITEERIDESLKRIYRLKYSKIM